MPDNRTVCGQGGGTTPRNDTICIDTYRVLDSCRDRDCYEDVRVYLDENGQNLINQTCVVRAVDAQITTVEIVIDEVPFNDGFFQLTLHYYVLITLEACVNGAPRGQTFYGIAAIEKRAVLWGGEGNVTVFRSTDQGDFCNCITDISTNHPIGVVETVPPIVLSVKVVDCHCPCGCCDVGCLNIPECVANLLDGPLVDPDDGNRLYISFGIFSVIRLQRPAQYLISASPYSVPDKECHTTDDSDPCSLFRTLAFPVDEFTPTAFFKTDTTDGRGCRCTRDHT